MIFPGEQRQAGPLHRLPNSHIADGEGKAGGPPSAWDHWSWAKALVSTFRAALPHQRSGCIVPANLQIISLGETMHCNSPAKSAPYLCTRLQLYPTLFLLDLVKLKMHEGDKLIARAHSRIVTHPKISLDNIYCVALRFVAFCVNLVDQMIGEYFDKFLIKPWAGPTLWNLPSVPWSWACVWWSELSSPGRLGSLGRGSETITSRAVLRCGDRTRISVSLSTLQSLSGFVLLLTQQLNTDLVGIQYTVHCTVWWDCRSHWSPVCLLGTWLTGSVENWKTRIRQKQHFDC